MTLTVRLTDPLESALALYCAERGVTKSLVVQESLARYLVEARAESGPVPTHKRGRAIEPGAVWQAFTAAGFIGAGDLGGVSATKAVVRGRAKQRAGSRA